MAFFVVVILPVDRDSMLAHSDQQACPVLLLEPDKKIDY